MSGVDGHSSTSEHRYALPEQSDQSLGPSVCTTLLKQPTTSLDLEPVVLNESEGCSTMERNSKRRRRVCKEYAKQLPKDSTGKHSERIDGSHQGELDVLSLTTLNEFDTEQYFYCGCDGR